MFLILEENCKKEFKWENLIQKRISLSNKLSELKAQIYIVCVGSQINTSGKINNDNLIDIFKKLALVIKKDDLVILVSSSGKSPNIIKAAQRTKELKLKLVTLTGFDKNNPLKKLGDLNLWVDSRAYNIIENTHLIWLLAVNDLIFGNAEYTA